MLEPQKDGVAKDTTLVPMRIPAGVMPVAFRSVLAAFTTAYRVNGRVPDVGEVHRLWPQISSAGVGEIMATPEFREALEGRGIVTTDTIGLTHVQHMALLAVSDPYDKRSLKAKLEACGATTQQYANWQRQPIWQAARKAIGSRIWEDGLEDLKTKMFQQAEAGSFQHQNFLLETLGEGPKAKEQANATEIVQRFVSAIARATVGHPEIRDAILQAMREDMIAVQALTE